MSNLDNFLKEYDSHDFLFKNVNYRQGAKITCPFGLASGYTVDASGSLLFDTVRIHTGVDRSAIYGNNGNFIRNAVYSPFNFNRSAAIYYGPKTSYGNLIQLYNDVYCFEMRIAHMNPQTDIIPEVNESIKKGEEIKRDTFLGQAGNFGLSGGAHTHTEFLSIKETCQVFDDLLLTKYGPEVDVPEYNDIAIHRIYLSKTLWIGKPFEEIKKHYESLKTSRNILFMNKYKYSFIDPNSNLKRTRYSSELLFNGL